MPSPTEKSYIGIDVSKARLDVFYLADEKHMQFNNNAQGVKKLISKLKLFQCPSVVMEATGGYERLAAQTLREAQIEVCVSNPRQIRDFAKALGKLAKTDKIDAKIIALFGQTVCPKPNVSYEAEQIFLSDYTARRTQLINMLTMEGNRLDTTSVELHPLIKKIMSALEEQIALINEEIELIFPHLRGH